MSSLVESVSPRKFPIAVMDIASGQFPFEGESYLPRSQLSYSDRSGRLYGYKSWTHWLAALRGFLRDEVCRESKGSQFSGSLEEVILDHF